MLTTTEPEKQAKAASRLMNLRFVLVTETNVHRRQKPSLAADVRMDRYWTPIGLDFLRLDVVTDLIHLR